MVAQSIQSRVPPSSTKPRPPKKPAMAKDFIQRLKLIFSGDYVTDPKLMYQPVTPDPQCPHHPCIGVISSPIARELHSLYRELAIEAKLQNPRNMSEVKDLQHKRNMLLQQSAQARSLFRMCAAVEFPELEDKHPSQFLLYDGWKVAIGPRIEESEQVFAIMIDPTH